MMQLEQTLSSTSQVAMVMAKEQWQKEQEEHNRKTIDAQVVARYASCPADQ